MMNLDEKKIQEILVAFGHQLSRIHAEAIPPEIGREAYRLISEKSGILDPYAKLKQTPNRPFSCILDSKSGLPAPKID